VRHTLRLGIAGWAPAALSRSEALPILEGPTPVEGKVNVDSDIKKLMAVMSAISTVVILLNWAEFIEHPTTQRFRRALGV
jgi:hypothetical protein